MAGFTVAPVQVLNQLIHDGLFDTLRKSITAELEGNMELKKFTTEQVERSQVLQAPGAERRSRRELFESLRRELQTKVLERASEAAWNAILSKDGVGFQIEEQVEKTWWELNGWGTPPERTRLAEQKPGVVNSSAEVEVTALDSSVVSEHHSKEAQGQAAEEGVDQSQEQSPDGAMAVPVVAAANIVHPIDAAPLTTEVQYVPLVADADSVALVPALATEAGSPQAAMGIPAAEGSKESEPVEMSLDNLSAEPGRMGENGGEEAAEGMATQSSAPEVELAAGPATEGPASGFANGLSIGKTREEDTAQGHQASTCKEGDTSAGVVSDLQGGQFAVAGGLRDSPSKRKEVNASEVVGEEQIKPSGEDSKRPRGLESSMGPELPVVDAREALGTGSLAEGEGVEGSSMDRPESEKGVTTGIGSLSEDQEPSPSSDRQEVGPSGPMEMHVNATQGALTAEPAAERQTSQPQEGQERTTEQ